jgi:hypothetical protein
LTYGLYHLMSMLFQSTSYRMHPNPRVVHQNQKLYLPHHVVAALKDVHLLKREYAMGAAQQMQ